LLGLFGAAALVKPSAARDQQPALPVAGVLSSLSHMAKFETAFRRGLAEMGYFDGQNVIIEYRWLEGGYDTLPQMAADLLQRQAAVIAAFGPPAVVAAILRYQPQGRGRAHAVETRGVRVGSSFADILGRLRGFGSPRWCIGRFLINTNAGPLKKRLAGNRFKISATPQFTAQTIAAGPA